MAIIDTILTAAVNPGAGPTAATVAASGDSLQVRAFQAPAKCYLENIIRMGTAGGFVQVRSPMLHDVARGIRITPAESPSLYSLPAEVAQTLSSGDVLITEMSGGAAETDIALLQLYYTDLGSNGARLFSPGDILGNIKSVKPQAVAVVSSATIGAWADVNLGATENVLHANADYAVLGYMTNAALGAIALRGQDTGQFRIGGPGSTLEIGTTEYFVRMSERTGRPHIPVINAANIGNTTVSVCSATASVAATVELILAELVSPLPSR